jgi:hypothetical protein
MSRAARRSAELSAFVRALYGPLEGGEVAGLDYDTLADTSAPLSVSRTEILARPHLLRRLLAPLILLGGHTNPSAEFRALVIAAVSGLRHARTSLHPAATDTHAVAPDAEFTHALARLRRWAQRRFALRPREEMARGVRAAMQLFEPEELLEVEPSYVRNSNGVFTVSRRARVNAPLHAVADAINPVNWATMGDFFEYVGRVGPGSDQQRADGWRGLFEEHYVVGWGPLTINSYKVFLNVDFTFDETRARVDYSLVYEQDAQLEVDDGYLEAKTIPGRYGWCDYYAEKSTKFHAPTSNLLAPAVMAVALESNLSSIEDAAYDRLESAKAGKQA